MMQFFENEVQYGTRFVLFMIQMIVNFVSISTASSPTCSPPDELLTLRSSSIFIKVVTAWLTENSYVKKTRNSNRNGIKFNICSFSAFLVVPELNAA